MAFHAFQLSATAARRLLVVILATSALTHSNAAAGGNMRKSSEADKNLETEIPPWKLDLIAGEGGGTWWSKYGPSAMSDAIVSAVWGSGMPGVTSSPGQDSQKCPDVKLPDSIIMGAKHRSWTSLHGEWQTPNAVKVAIWEQDYMGMGLSKDIKRVGVEIRAPSTGKVSARTRYFSNREMHKLFSWQEPVKNSGIEVTDKRALKDNNFEDVEEGWNLAVFDCIGTLMYVVKKMDEFPKYLKVYSREGTLLAESYVGAPIIKYSFIDPRTGYLMADAEAPGVGANISASAIPEEYKVHHILPFGMHFQTGGYANASALIEPEYRWVLAAAVQALTIYNAPQDTDADIPWPTITVIRTIWILLIAGAFASVVGMILGIYFCIYPPGERITREAYGKISENPFLVVPNRPPHRDEHQAVAKYRLGTGYGANN